MRKDMAMFIVTIIIAAGIIGITAFTVLMPDSPPAGLTSPDDDDGNATTTDMDLPKLTSVTFYSDGNPNTGETATLYLGKENVGKVVQVKTTYYRDNSAFNNPDYVELKIDDDGYVKLTDNTPMPKYPDFCEISVLYNGTECGGSVNIGKYNGTQTVTINQ